MSIQNTVFLLLSLTAATAIAADTIPNSVAVTEKIFGAAIPADAPVQSLTQAVRTIDPSKGDQVISGRVTQVCQKAGCWMILTDGDVFARVMTQYKFELPKELKGNAVVLGKIEAFDLDEKESLHMAKDAGVPASAINTREYRIAAQGVALR